MPLCHTILILFSIIFLNRVASTFSEQTIASQGCIRRRIDKIRRPTAHRHDEVVLHSLILEFLLRCSLPSVLLLPFCTARCCCSRKLILPRHCRNQLDSIAAHVLYDVLLRAHVRDPLLLVLPPCQRSSCNVVLRNDSCPST